MRVLLTIALLGSAISQCGCTGNSAKSPQEAYDAAYAASQNKEYRKLWDLNDKANQSLHLSAVGYQATFTDKREKIDEILARHGITREQLKDCLPNGVGDGTKLRALLTDDVGFYVDLCNAYDGQGLFIFTPGALTSIEISGDRATALDPDGRSVMFKKTENGWVLAMNEWSVRGSWRFSEVTE